MAMLAERKRKQKGCLNPQGKYWSNDTNKFGQKMLEKMGWSNGKGLGINEQGSTEHVRVAFKNNTAGIGYDISNSNNWIEHQKQFDDLLQQLQKNHDQEAIQKLENKDETLDGQSLELKCKQSRTRIYYKKFIRGKDINKYSSKDLANILGQKELTNKEIIKKEESNIDEKEDIGSNDNKNGITTINRGNMADYFKLKRQNCNKIVPCNTFDKEIDSENKIKQCSGLGFSPNVDSISSPHQASNKISNYEEKDNYAFDNPCLTVSSPTETQFSTDDSSKKSVKKKKSSDLHIYDLDNVNTRKKLQTDILSNNYKDGFINPALNLDIESNEDYNTCSKKFEVSRAQFGLENCALDLADERNNKKHVTFNNHVEYNTDITKKRKRKVTLDKFEVENKKYKKKQKQDNITTTVLDGFVNEALDVEIICEEINDNEFNERKNGKIKKKKKYKQSNLETIQESPEREKQMTEITSEIISDTNIVENGEMDATHKKSKKKKKIKIEKVGVGDNTNQNIETEEKVNHKKIKIKKSKEEEIVISKKCKERKDDKIAKLKKNTFGIDTSSNQQNTTISEKPGLKEENNHPIEKKEKNTKQEIFNKDSIKAVSSIVNIKTKEKAVLGDIECKKRKKNKHKENYSKNDDQIDDAEKKISDKENAEKDTYKNQENVKKEHKKHKKSKENNTPNSRKSSDNSREVTSVNINIEQEKNDIISKSDEADDVVNNVIQSQPDTTTRIRKKMSKIFYHDNMVIDFPGSNIYEIKGYGTDFPHTRRYS